MPFWGKSISCLWILPAPSNEDNPGHWFRPIKRILIPKHGNYFLVESSTLKAFESGLQLKESGILLKIIMYNPSSTDKDRNSVPRIQNPRLGIQNSRLSSNWTPLQDVLGGINLSIKKTLDTLPLARVSFSPNVTVFPSLIEHKVLRNQFFIERGSSFYRNWPRNKEPKKIKLSVLAKYSLS